MNMKVSRYWKSHTNKWNLFKKNMCMGGRADQTTAHFDCNTSTLETYLIVKEIKNN